MILKYISIFSILLLAFGCSSQYEKALRSTDEAFVFETAEKEYEKEKWSRAVDLYKYGKTLFNNSDTISTAAYKTAYANYKIESFSRAARQFKNFYDDNPNSDKKEEALFMSGYSYYLSSAPYNLDQKTTLNAIQSLQYYLEKYPNSEKLDDVNKYVAELRKKLEKKNFEIALTYYKIFSYRAAIVSFSNILEEYPDTYLKEQIHLYLVRSRYELATKSILKKKKTRLKEAILQTNTFAKKFPSSKYLDETQKLQTKLKLELEAVNKNNNS